MCNHRKWIGTYVFLFANSVFNKAYQDSILSSPYLNYGMHPPYPDIVALAQVNDVYVQDMEKGLMKAKECLTAVQRRMASHADQHRRDVQYEVGDFVYVSNKNIKMKFEGSKKFMGRYIGLSELSRKLAVLPMKLISRLKLNLNARLFMSVSSNLTSVGETGHCLASSRVAFGSNWRWGWDYHWTSKYWQESTIPGQMERQWHAVVARQV